jgi:hypothetical protein
MRRSLMFAVLVGMTGGASNLLAQCRPADVQTTTMIRYMRQLATATPADSESVTVRTSYKIPAVAASQVALVTTARICRSALSAFRTAVPLLLAAPSSVYVIAVGNVYVVWADGSPLSEWTQHVVFDSKFQILAEFAG